MSTRRVTAVADDGHELRVTVRGDGPTLLFLPGGIGLSTGYAPLVKLLSESYSLAMYDRRGHGPQARQAPVDPATMTVERHGADAAAVVDALGDGPIRMVGSSTGAVIGLELLATRPESLRGLLAHEPPLAAMLDDADRWLGWYDDIGRINALGETRIAAEYFFANLVSDGLGEQPAVPLLPSQLPDWEVYLRAEVPRVIRYQPATAGDGLICAYGADGEGRWHARATEALARHVGGKAVAVPGGHLGPAYQPAGFADAVRALLP